ncbi:hypothetical protein KC356_g356 [Hortaea werneckii]|nr:hypothetical protein KC356_g356 [Hortaea werneckii]
MAGFVWIVAQSNAGKRKASKASVSFTCCFCFSSGSRSVRVKVFVVDQVGKLLKLQGERKESFGRSWREHLSHGKEKPLHPFFSLKCRLPFSSSQVNSTLLIPLLPLRALLGNHLTQILLIHGRTPLPTGPAPLLQPLRLILPLHLILTQLVIALQRIQIDRNVQIARFALVTALVLFLAQHRHIRRGSSLSCVTAATVKIVGLLAAEEAFGADGAFLEDLAGLTRWLVIFGLGSAALLPEVEFFRHGMRAEVGVSVPAPISSSLPSSSSSSSSSSPSSSSSSSSWKGCNSPQRLLSTCSLCASSLSVSPSLRPNISPPQSGLLRRRCIETWNLQCRIARRGPSLLHVYQPGRRCSRRHVQGFLQLLAQLTRPQVAQIRLVLLTLVVDLAVSRQLRFRLSPEEGLVQLLVVDI